MDDTALLGTARAPWAAVSNSGEAPGQQRCGRRLHHHPGLGIVQRQARRNSRAGMAAAGELADGVQQHQLHGAVRPLHLCPLRAVPGNPGRQLGAGLRQSRHLRHGRRDLPDSVALHLPVRLCRRRLSRAFARRSTSHRGLRAERRRAAEPALRLQVCRLVERRVQRHRRQPGPRHRDRPVHPAAAAGHLLLYLPHDQLHGRHLQAYLQADRHVRRLRDLRFVLSPADRRPDRPRLRAAAPGRRASPGGIATGG